jgi:mono/diheme cytochrome c family protein
VTRNELLLALAALVLIVFSLVSAIVIPRRYEDFPGERLGFFAVVSVALVIGMLGAVELFGEERHGGEAAAEERGGENIGPGTTGETAPPPPPGQGSGQGGQGDAAAGREVYTNVANPSCGGCHTFGPAGTNATAGPNLDEALSGADPAFVRESIVDPNAEIAEGFQEGVMPDVYGEQLSEQQLNDLVAFLTQGG